MSGEGKGSGNEPTKGRHRPGSQEFTFSERSEISINIAQCSVLSSPTSSPPISSHFLVPPDLAQPPATLEAD